MATLKSSKNQASSIPLRYGCVWNWKTARDDLESTWTRGYVSWANSAELGGGHAKEALDFCMQAVEENRERVRALGRRLVAMGRASQVESTCRPACFSWGCHSRWARASEAGVL